MTIVKTTKDITKTYELEFFVQIEQHVSSCNQTSHIEHKPAATGWMKSDFFARQVRLQTEARMSQIADLFASYVWNSGNDLPNVC